MRFFLLSTFGNISSLGTWLRLSGRTIAALLAAMAAPLRRIVARDVAVTMPDARNPRYRIYSLIDTLECGHEYDAYLFGGLEDLTFAYTQNPAVTAKRRRCRPCASLLAKKRPQSVPLPVAVKTA